MAEDPKSSIWRFKGFWERRPTPIVAAGVSPAVEPWRPARRQERPLKTSFPSHANLVRFMEGSVFHSDRLAVLEPQRVGVREDEEIVTMSIRGSLAPQRGEGLRVRGETTSVVETKCLRFMERLTTPIVAAGVSPAVEPWRPARRQERPLKTSFPSHANLVKFMERTELRASVQPLFEVHRKNLCPVHFLRSLRSVAAKFLSSPLRVSASPRELRSGRSAPSPLRGERAGVRGGGSANLFSAFSSVKSGLFAPPLRVNPLPATRGFTLIEIMMVVAIMGLVAATGLPSIIANLKKEGMRKAVSDVETICRNARQNAILTGKRTSITFYPAEKKLQLDGGAGTYETSSATLPDNVEIAMLDINLEDYGASPWAKVFFNPNGTSDELTLVLLSGGEYKKISLEFSTSLTFVTDVNQ